MLQAPPRSRSAGIYLATRRQIALDRIQQLIVSCEARVARAWGNYYFSQGFTIGLAAQLVVQVDGLNLESVARWSSAELAETPPTAETAKPTATT